MHTYIAEEGTVLNFNSDFSGDIRIRNPESEEEVWIPGEDLIEFFAYFKLEIEQAEKRIKIRRS